MKILNENSQVKTNQKLLEKHIPLDIYHLGPYSKLNLSFCFEMVSRNPLIRLFENVNSIIKNARSFLMRHNQPVSSYNPKSRKQLLSIGVVAQVHWTPNRK